MITIDSLMLFPEHSYTALIKGNGGEEELIISCSCGQDGHSALIISAMSIDGGGRVLLRACRPVWEIGVQTSRVMHYIHEAMLGWCCGGIKPSSAQRADIEVRVSETCTKIAHDWHLEDMI